MKFEIGDYVIRTAAPEFVWKVIDASRSTRPIVLAYDDDDDECYLTLAPICTIDGKPPLANIKQQSWSWDCEAANAMLVIAYEANRD